MGDVPDHREREKGEERGGVSGGEVRIVVFGSDHQDADGDENEPADEEEMDRLKVQRIGPLASADEPIPSGEPTGGAGEVEDPLKGAV